MDRTLLAETIELNAQRYLTDATRENFDAEYVAGVVSALPPGRVAEVFMLWTGRAIAGYVRVFRDGRVHKAK